MSPYISEYEKERLKNIQKRNELLASLGANDLKPKVEPKEKLPTRKKATDKKRKRADPDFEDKQTPDEPPAKVDRIESDETSGIRRSQRNAGKTIDYTGEGLRLKKEALQRPSVQSGLKSVEDAEKMGREDGKRIHDPKTFGSIPGIPVGTWWEKRQGCSIDAIHAPLVAGISGGNKGAYSVALSGGYDDDVDWGYAFTYTGSGGRDLKGTKANPKNLRTGPQEFDQTFENSFNKALKISCETKRPIRVIRGYKLQSDYAPSEGYRYDGLYTVEKAWIEKGLNPGGFLVCKFAFKRIPGQPAIPVRNSSAGNEEQVPADDDDDGGGDSGVENSDVDKTEGTE